MKTAPSPKDEMASLIARSICSLSSDASLTTLIPFPPPPALAFISNGKPISFAILNASSGSSTASSVPGTIGMPNFFTAALAASLLPMRFIA